MSRGRRILMVVTSNERMGPAGEPTGLWLEELTTPYFVLRDAGHEVDVVSVAGGKVPLDPRSVGGTNEDIPSVKRARGDEGLKRALEESRSIEDVDASGYDAIFLPGGHGTMWDLPHSSGLARALTAFAAEDRPIAAVCHGPAGLINARLPDGRPIVAGRKVSAFTAEEEEAVGLKDKIPHLLDAQLYEAGAELVSGPPFSETAVRDGDLITGQNPQSAGKVARLLVESLG